MTDFIRINDPEPTRFEAEAFPFNIFRIKNATTLGHWHKHLEFIVIEAGDITIGVNDVMVLGHPGDIIMVAPGCLHSIKCQVGKYKAVVIGDHLLNEFELRSEMHQIIGHFIKEESFDLVTFRLGEPNTAMVASYLSDIEKEFVEERQGHQAMIRLGLCQMMVAISRMGLVHGHTIKPDLNIHTIKKALTYIDQHFNESIHLKTFGKLTNLSDQHFSRIFKAYMGKTVMEYLMLYRLDKSNWYLTHTDLPITEIPEKVGICNANYYARIYKRQYGYSPSSARRTIVS